MRRLGTILLLIGLGLSPARALDVYYLRHAETVANVTRDYSAENQRTFSEKGKRQIASLTRYLQRFHFDAILVGPSERTRLTILPYLEATGQRAEIWPELGECCWQKKRAAPASAEMPRGKRLELPDREKPHFFFPDERDRYPYYPKTYADGVQMIEEVVARLRQRFDRTDKTILIVGHYHAGGHLIERLAGPAPTGRYALRNGRVSHLKQLPDGSWKVLTINGYSLKSGYTKKTHKRDAPAAGKKPVVTREP